MLEPPSAPPAALHERASLSGLRHVPPRVGERLLHRPALAARLESAPGILTVLCAPPGSGKTTALAQHYHALQQRGAQVCWLRLTPQDNEPSVLLRHLAQALGNDGAARAEEAPSFPESTHVFVDGLEWLHVPASQGWIAQFLLALPASSCAYATAHSLQDPALQEGRLRGLVQPLGPELLRWSVAETAELFGADWTRDQISWLHYQMHGWIGGLRLLAQSPQPTRRWLQDARPHAPLPDDLASYMEHLLTSILPPASLQALMELSVLERFPPELLASLPQAPCTWELVDQLLRQGGFLVEDPWPSTWVCFQPAWGEHLRRRMRRHHPVRCQELQQFAAAWLAEHGHTDEALRHAARIEDPLQRERLLEQADAPLMLNLGEGPELPLEAALPAERAGERPLHFLGQVYHRFRHGRLEEAHSMFQRASMLTEDFARIQDPARQEEVRGWHCLLRVALRCAQDLPVDAPQLVQLKAQFQFQSARHPLLAAGIASVHAFVLLDQGQYAEALAVCQSGLRIQQSQHMAKVRIFLRLHQAYAAIAEDCLDSAQHYLEDAQRLAHRNCAYHSYEMHSVRWMWLLLHYERNELETVRRLLPDVLQQLRAVFGFPRIYGEMFAIAVHLAGLQGDLPAAERLLQDVRQLAHERHLPRLLSMVHVLRLHLLMRQQAWQAAQEWVETPEFQEILSPENGMPYRHSVQVPARLAIAQLDVEQGRMRAALLRLQQLPPDWKRTADQRLQWQFHLLQLRAHAGLKHYRAAAESLHAALALAHRADLRLRCIEARPHWQPLRELLEQRGRPLPEPLRRWLDALPSPDGADGEVARSPTGAASPRLSPLSPRESEILALMAEGCINKEIAARLGISEGTVKTHRKHIHEKLGASSRSQALQRAREWMLL